MLHLLSLTVQKNNTTTQVKTNSGSSVSTQKQNTGHNGSWAFFPTGSRRMRRRGPAGSPLPCVNACVAALPAGSRAWCSPHIRTQEGKDLRRT